MRSLSGNYSMCHQIPMMFLHVLLLVYLSAADCISEEIILGSCWRRDILTFKDERSSANHKMLLFVSWRNQYAIIEWPLFDAPTSTHGVFAFFSLSIGAVAYIAVQISLGSCWRRDILRSKAKHFPQIPTIYEFVRLP